MACSSDSKKSHQSDPYSNSKDKVCDELPFLREENERLGKLLDNRDDMLREAKKMRKELKASLEDARSRVAELETQNLDARLEIDSLKASPMVSDDVDCVGCSIYLADCSNYLADLASLKDKHVSTCDELDVLRVQVAELKFRPALLGACTSYPVLHGKIDEMHACPISLEAKLKEPIPTSCSTCELHVVKNLELAHYVDRLQDENGELRKCMSWLSGQEPQLGIMIASFKSYDGQALGADKLGENSGEGVERVGEIPIPPPNTHKNKFEPKPNHLRNKLDTNLDPPIFPHPTNDFQKPVKFVSPKGGEDGEKKKGEKSSEQPQTKPKP
jgi:hypothetical protein